MSEPDPASRIAKDATSKRQQSIGRWLLFLADIVLAGASVLMWHSVSTDRRRHVVAMTEDAAKDLRQELLLRMHTRLSALRRIARRVSMPAEFPAKQWKSDAAVYLQDLTGLEALDWIGPDLELLAAVPAPHAAWPRRRAPPPELRRVFEEARETRKPALSHGFEALPRQRFLAAVFPILRSNRMEGAITARFREKELMESLVGSIAPGYAVRIRDATGEIYLRGRAGAGVQAQQTVELPGTNWQIEVWPEDAALSQPGQWGRGWCWESACGCRRWSPFRFTWHKPPASERTA